MKIGFGLGISDYRLRGGGLDPDALAFIAAEETAGATFDANQKDAINKLFLNLKGQGPDNNTVDFWTTNKVRRWWPLVGGIAAANQIDVRLNAGVFNGGWTHSVDGAKGNGTNTWFNSFTAFTGEANFNWGFGYYGAEYTAGDWMCGIIDYSLSTGVWAIRDITGAPNEFWNAGRGSASATANTSLDFIGARLAFGIGDDIYLRWNSSLSPFIGLGTPSGNTAVNMVFGNALDNFGGLYGANDMEYRSFHIEYDITVAESLILTQIDNAFQTQLGRNTY